MHAIYSGYNNSEKAVPDLIQEEVRRNIIRIVNILAGLTFVLAFVFGNILYTMSGEDRILNGASIEALLCILVLMLNYRKRLPAAILVTFFIHSGSVLYFGLILSPSAQVQGMAIFLGGLAYLIFQSRQRRAVALTLIAGIIVTIEVNYELHFVSTVNIGDENALRRMVIATVISLDCLMLYLVIREVIRYRDRVSSSMQQLQQAKRAISRYVRETSHQSRIDLNVVFGIIQNALAEASGREDSAPVSIPLQNLRAAYNSTKATIDHINNSLEWSRIEQGLDFPLHQEAFDLHQWLNELCERFRHLAVDRPAGLMLKQFPSVPRYITQDKNRLDAILGNLLTNAIKFTNKRTTVTLIVQAQGDRLYFSVADQGKGITPERLKTIFTPFTAEANGFKQGTGLGLPVARQLTQALGGDITVVSQPGHGTSFRVDLPLVIADAAQVKPPSSHEHHFEGISALIVEDNKMSRMVAFQGLQRTGMQVYTSETAAEAMKKLSCYKIEVVLLDYQLPDSEAPEIIRWIRANPMLQNIIIIVTSGDAYTNDKSDARKLSFGAGANGFIVKPISHTELFAEIEKNLHPDQITLE